MTKAGTMTTIEARGCPGHAHQRHSTIVSGFCHRSGPARTALCRQSFGDIQATSMRRRAVPGGRHGSGYGD